MIVLTSNSTTYQVTNKKLIKTSKFKLVFTVLYTGRDVPSGTCSELQIMTSKYSRDETNQSVTFWKILSIVHSQRLDQIHHESRSMVCKTRVLWAESGKVIHPIHFFILLELLPIGCRKSIVFFFNLGAQKTIFGP